MPENFSIKFPDGGGSGSGKIISINGLTAPAQFIVVGTDGSDFNVVSTVDTHTLNLPTASAINRGALSSADWSLFNSKGTGVGYSGEATNFAALPDPTTVSGQFWFVLNAQGTAWLPGSLGGTYYPVGTYYSNGTTWITGTSAYQASQAVVDAGIVTDQFVSPNTLANWSGRRFGTVTSVSIVTANGISGTVATATTTPAITLTLGAITPTSVNGNTVTAGTGTLTLSTFTVTAAANATISGTNTGDQTITLTGDVTGSGTASFAATIGTNKVTYAKMQQASAVTLLGNPTGGAANVSEITLGSGLSFSGTTLVATGTGGTVTSVASADGSITVTNPTTTVDLAVVKAPKLSTARTIGGVSFDGTANITVATATGGFTVSGGDLALGANNITMSGSIGTTGTRVLKGWFTDLQVTNAITGSITGNAATVTTNANLTGEVTSVGNAATLTNSAVIGKVLTGYVSGAGTVAATDTILQAIQKLNGNTAALGSIYLTVANPAYTGTLTTGTLGYSDTGILASYQSSTNSYNQTIIRNTNNGSAASASYIVSNDVGTATTNFGEFGINSSTYTGSGSLNLAGATYLTSTTGDLVIGSTTSNSIRFVINSGTTDVITVGTGGIAVFTASSTDVATVRVLDSTYKTALSSNALNTLQLGAAFTTLSTASTTTQMNLLASTFTLQATGAIMYVSARTTASSTIACHELRNASSTFVSLTSGTCIVARSYSNIIASSSGTAVYIMHSVGGGFAPTGTGTTAYTFLSIDTNSNNITQSSGQTGVITGIDINPSITAMYGTMYGIRIRNYGVGTGSGINNALTSEHLGASSFAGTVTITGFTDGSSAAAGKVGEVISSTISTYTNYTTTATYQNITSISLTAGDWDIYAFGTLSSNAATITLAANTIFVVSTTTASAAGATEGLNISYIPQASLVGTSKESSGSIMFPVSISSTTIYYLNTQATFTIGNPQFVGSIRARRRR